MMRWWWLTVMMLLAACSGVPQGLQPVSGFELERYFGRWYEIARLDHSFEHGLTHVTAEYRLLPEGRVEVINRGFDPAKAAWRDAKGVARFQGARDIGSLEVSFLGRFMAGTTCWCSTPIIATHWWRGRAAIICGYSRATRNSIAPPSKPWSPVLKSGGLPPTR